MCIVQSCSYIQDKQEAKQLKMRLKWRLRPLEQALDPKFGSPWLGGGCPDDQTSLTAEHQ